MECKGNQDKHEKTEQEYVLIETLWNVKRQMWTFEELPLIRINRNIVECKDDNRIVAMKQEFRINRNIVECKVFKVKRIPEPILVLIETLWNVKLFLWLKLLETMKKY